jgi:putative hydrolase of the HAD superfamily
MIEAVLFDLDDTLLDHATAMAEAVVRLHAHVNTAEPFESFRDRWRASHARHYPGFLCGRITYEEAVLARVRETIDSAIDASSSVTNFACRTSTIVLQ